ncbi:MAG TPA: 50S ribosomal protein L11 methyltransferase [Terriglobia bacterium]|nr:50S ribosomal protein L11 methyltransferase [Terriglobia bacterium]
MPYRIDISSPPSDALDLLVELGALDIEPANNGLAAILPDSVTRDLLAIALGTTHFNVSPAVSRDNGSVWLLTQRPVRIASALLRLTDSTVFGSGHHPTTALCGEVLQERMSIAIPHSILDVGTGSGILALTTLIMGVPQAVGLDIDACALEVAARNASLNDVSHRLQLVLGGPDAVSGAWPLVVANILAAPLIEMAPVLVRRVESGGCLILSGISASLESEVRQIYVRLGMRHTRSVSRGGWTLLVFQPSW